jgi:hypothetical protein
MALSRVAEARLYYQAAKQRFDDAVFLLEARRTTGAIYLAGYCVECMLKALILSQLAKKPRAEMFASFRGSKAHDYGWLKQQYFESGGPPLPKEVVREFAFVST